MEKAFRISKNWLLFWCFFIGIGAIIGAVGFWLDPTGKTMGMDTLLPYFQVLPFADFFFQDYIWCGVALLCVNGITNITAALLILQRKKWGIILGGLFGVTLMLWITIQFIIFPLEFMDILYMFFGICQTVTGIFCYRFYKLLNNNGQ